MLAAGGEEDEEATTIESGSWRGEPGGEADDVAVEARELARGDRGRGEASDSGVEGVLDSVAASAEPLTNNWNGLIGGSQTDGPRGGAGQTSWVSTCVVSSHWAAEGKKYSLSAGEDESGSSSHSCGCMSSRREQRHTDSRHRSLRSRTLLRSAGYPMTIGVHGARVQTG